jgi:hypothetical protein
MRGEGSSFPWGVLAVILLTAGAIVGAARLAYREFVADSSQSEQADASLSSTDYSLYESVLAQSSDHLERGATLLGLGLTDGALTEFARAVNVFEESRLGRNPLIRPRIDAIRATVRDIYRSRNTTAPSAYRRAKATRVNLAAGLRAALSIDEFLLAAGEVQRLFLDRFQAKFEITGQDHPEHVGLYGPGGAIDIRVRGLSTAQVGFLIAGFNSLGARVKDFSSDQVLQAQIAAALKAGLPGRAGTGLHLHVDRFADRFDPYTVR